MRPSKQIALLLAVTAVAACRDDSSAAPPGAPAADVADPAAPAAAPLSPDELDDDEVVRLVIEAAATGDPAVVPPRLPASVSRTRAGVVALHDALLSRRGDPPRRDALFAALDALARAEGGADAATLAPLVAAWRGWSDADFATETELARSLSIATSSLSLPQAPGADGLAELAKRAAAAGAAPSKSPGAAGIAFVRYAALALGDAGSEVSPQQDAAFREACEAFEGLGWPGGFALLAEPLANLLLQRDPVGVRGNALWSNAADAYRASGDLYRAGAMYLDRARATWSGEASAERLRRAVAFATTGRERVVASGATGPALVEAYQVEATLLQALGRHADAIAAAEGALQAAVGESVLLGHETARLRLLQAVSHFRLGRHEKALELAQNVADSVRGEQEGGDDEPRRILAEALETAGEAALAAGHAQDAARAFESAAAQHAAFAERDGDAAEARAADTARLLRARALSRGGDTAAARAAVHAIVSGRAQSPALLALAADVLLDADAVDDAAQIVAQCEAALPPERRVVLGELRGRIAAARGDVAAARAEFQAALDHITGGDGEAHGWPAARVLDVWSEVEARAGERGQAAALVAQAISHILDTGLDGELTRLRVRLDELRR